MLEYYLILIVVFFSLYFGMILAFMAKEELEDGRKYFLLAEKILTALMFALVLLFLKFNYYIIAILSIVFLIILILSKRTIKDQFLYPLFAVIFFMLYDNDLSNNNFFMICTSVIFIYGLFAGTLFTEKLIKKKKFKTLKIHRAWYKKSFFLYVMKKIFVNFVSFLIIGFGLKLF